MSKKLNLLFLAAILIFLCLGLNAAYAYTLSGIIYGGSNPMPNATVNLYDAGSGNQLHSTVTNSSGFYSFTVDNGTYNLLIVPPSGSGFDEAVVNGIPVNGADVTQNVVLIQQAYILSGVVRAPDGTPVSNINVEARDQSSDVVVGFNRSDASGNYSIPLAAGTYHIRVMGGRCYYGVSNIPTPQRFYIDAIVNNLVITANTVRDINLPLVTLSGKTTDSNGVPVGGVTIKVPDKGWSSQVTGWNYCGNDCSPYVVSDASGNYSMTLLSYNNYSEIIIPPTGSGFAQTIVNNLSVTHDILQNIILNMPDDDPPIILSGPTVTSITCNSAVVEWQTNEGTKGGLKYGTSSPPGTTITESNYYVLHSMPLTGLIPDTEYFVQVYGSDYYNNGPVYSDIVSFRTKLLCGDTTPPVFIEGPTVGHFACTGEVVTWKTDEPATGRVCYGQAEPLNTCINAPNLSMSYQVVLNGLQADTIYLMKVTVTDSSNNSTTSPIISFRTQAVYDVTPPVITEGPMAIDISDTEATIIWKTDEPATSGVSYNDGTHYGIYTDNTLVTNHSVRLTGLTQSTTYNYTVSSKDACGNGPALSQAGQFTTIATPCVKPVIIEGPVVVNVTHQSAVIRWITDVPANTIIEYGTTQSLGSVVSRAALVRHHNLPITGLEEDTDYFFRVLSYNPCSNDPVVSDIYTFHTDLVPDTKKPVVTIEPQVIHKTDKAATIYWETDEPADTVIDYGEGSTLSLQRSDGEKIQTHQMTLTNLQPSTGYSQAISSTDLSGNNVASDTPTGFSTSPAADITAPVITEGPAVIATTDNKATIRWVTNEIADSRVNYNVQGQPLNLFAGDIAQVFEHIVVLTNLQPGRTYSFKVASADPSSNGPTSSSTLNFMTQATPDLTGPVFTTAPFASGVSKTGAVIEWDTDEPSTTQIKYGTSSDQLNSQTALPGLENIHSIVLTNLNPGTTYYFSAMSMDSSGNLSESPVGQFTTVALDTTPPSGSISINSGANNTNSTTVTLSLSCTDASGCAHMQFSNDNTVWSTPEDYQTSKTWILSSGDGTKTVHVKFQDGAGIWSGAIPDSITLQTIPPITTASPAGGTYTSVLSVTLTVNKPATIHYTTDGNDPTTSFPVYSSQISITTTTTLKFFAVDNAGNQETVKTEIYTINPSSVTLLVPNGGDVLPSGGTYAICWEAPSNAVKFDLMYSINNGTSWSLIKSVTGLNCTHWEEIPVVTVNKKKCRVKVIGYNASGMKVGEDTSDKTFTIEVVKVISPDGGEYLRQGTTQAIIWRTNKTVSPVVKTKLLYSIDGGTTWKLITTRNGNTGSYPWEVPYISSTKCKVKVILKDSSGNIVGSDVSDKVFTIMP